MSLDEKRRQKKLAKKAAKRKAKLDNRKNTSGFAGSAFKDEYSFSDSPVHECFVPEGLFEIGLGNVLLSRKMPNGDIACSVFLVDVYCLGVKNAHFFIRKYYEYDYMVNQLRKDGGLKNVQPEYTRKLVEQAKAYAEDLGFSPHPDYHTAGRIFGDINTELCSEQFAFGKDGKPLFVSGPKDSHNKCMNIIKTLTDRCGPGGFHYMIGMNDPEQD